MSDRRRFTVIRGGLSAAAALGLLSACNPAREAQRPPAGDSVAVPLAPTRPIDDSIVARARQRITDYLEGSVVSARGEPPQLDLCYQDPTYKSVGSLMAVARARVLGVAPLGPARPRPDSLSVNVELLVVASAPAGDATWQLTPSVRIDSVQLTLVRATNLPGVEWSLCWHGHGGAGFAGPPRLLRAADSADVDDVRWVPPLTSWSSLAGLADSARWGSLQTLAGDTAIARVALTGGFADRLGVLQSTRDGRMCITIADSTLPPGTPLLVVSAGTPQTTARALIEGRRTRPCTMPGDEWGSVSIPGASHYHAVMAPGSSVTDPAIVVAGRPDALRLDRDPATIDVDGDGRAERFEKCASQEGIHLTVKTGVGPSAIERWRQYFYVPYDLEPNCR